jgi:DNA polymerase-1
MDSGKSLVEHLQSKGIVGLGNELAPTSDSFMQHIKNVEGRFWGERFQVYDRWRKDWHREYMRNGFINTLTGFRIWGVFKRNEVINSPVQGAAFHCLLKSIVELTKRIAQRKMGTQLVVQIHDSLVAVVPRSELQEYIELAYEVMTQYIRQVWPWIIVNLKTEVEVAEGSWATKKAYHLN